MEKLSFKLVIMLIVSAVVYIAVNYYIGKRVYSGISLFKNVNLTLYWIIFYTIACCFILAMVLGRKIPPAIYNTILVVGNYYIGILGYLILIIPITDVILYLNKKYSFTSLNLAPGLTIAIFVGLIYILVVGTWNGANHKVKGYNITINKELKDEKLNIVLVSDIHIGDVIDKARVEKMVSKINELNPDLVLIAGDLIDSNIRPYFEDNIDVSLGKIETKYGVYFALGNHDIYTGQLEELEESLSAVGIKTLRDEKVLVNDSFYIVGRDDDAIKRLGEDRKPIDEIISGVDKEKPIFLIDHTPLNLSEPQENKIDLQVSGHTHRGQFAPYNIVTNNIFEVDYGFKKKDDLNVIVSSGYGTWGPPIRVGSRSEIVQIHVNGKK